ncbi:MAG: hypothetical protein JXR81_06015 [Candidatus Goldbacteria bacterium]|nr:hypothetical protein [Candidatus Goldiibacteriota bacterium]
MKQIIKEYRYRSGYLMMSLITLMFGAGAFVLYHLATTNDRGLIINGFIKLNESQADIFYYVLTGFSVVFAIAGIVIPLLEMSSKVPRVLTVYDDGISFPLRKEMCEFKWHEITNMTETNVQGTIIIELTPVVGKKYSINNRMFKSKKEFEEVYSILKEKIKIQG